jgi:hypothetical protein
MLNREFSSLEESCLGHLHGDPKKPHGPTGHALITTAQMRYLSNNFTSRTAELAESSFESASATILEQLLNPSSSVCSENELTPVQAWHKIRQQLHFGEL